MRLIACLLWLLPAVAHAGAWSRTQGSYYVKPSLDIYLANGFKQAGRSIDQPYLSYQLALYGEVGLAKKWPVQLWAQTMLTSGTVFQDNLTLIPRGTRATTTRLGDLRLGLQTALTNKRPITIGLETKVPLYRNDTVGSKYAEYYQDWFPLPGDGQVDLTGWFLLGASFKNTPLWNDLGVGYRHRTEWFVGWQTRDPDLSFVDGIVFYDTFGASVGKWVLMARVDGVKNLQPDPYTREFVSLGPMVMFDMREGLALEFRFAADLWANNAGQGFGGGIGVSWRK